MTADIAKYVFKSYVKERPKEIKLDVIPVSLANRVTKCNVSWYHLEILYHQGLHILRLHSKTREAFLLCFHHLSLPFGTFMHHNQCYKMRFLCGMRKATAYAVYGRICGNLCNLIYADFKMRIHIHINKYAVICGNMR